ncbi:PRELI domain containing protein 3B-like [Oscarella lobularis]|uniref:PRELI domain containing protein 3B-like n=1 Tax=Oscarella lobularis TaxID=121494 RepID=UPI003313413B
MKIWSSNHTFSYSWESISQAAWRKYPNPMNPNVVGTDVLSRRVDDSGRLHTHRVITTAQWPFPDFVSRLIGFDKRCYVTEYSIIDPATKTMTLRSKNVTLASWMAVEETLIYQEHPDDANKTLLTQEAQIFGSSALGIPSYFEGLVVDGMSSNASKGREAMDWVCKKIMAEMQDLAAGAQQLGAAMGFSSDTQSSV